MKTAELCQRAGEFGKAAKGVADLIMSQSTQQTARLRSLIRLLEMGFDIDPAQSSAHVLAINGKQYDWSVLETQLMDVHSLRTLVTRLEKARSIIEAANYFLVLDYGTVSRVKAASDSLGRLCNDLYSLRIKMESGDHAESPERRAEHAEQIRDDREDR